jgi:hypothetical protein
MNVIETEDSSRNASGTYSITVLIGQPTHNRLVAGPTHAGPIFRKKPINEKRIPYSGHNISSWPTKECNLSDAGSDEAEREGLTLLEF